MRRLSIRALPAAVLSLAMAPVIPAATAVADELRDGFDGFPPASVESIETGLGTLRASAGRSVIVDADGGRALALGGGGASARVEIDLSDAARRTLGASGELALRVRRTSRRRPFVLRVGSLAGAEDRVTYDVSGSVSSEEFAWIDLPIGPEVAQLWIEAEVAGPRPLLIDEIVLRPPAPMELVDSSTEVVVRPLVLGRAVEILRMDQSTRGALDPLLLDRIEVERVRPAGSGANGEVAAPVVSLTELVLQVVDGDELARWSRDEPGGSGAIVLSPAAPLAQGRSEISLLARFDALDGATAATAVGLQIELGVRVRITGDALTLESEDTVRSRTAVDLGPLGGGGATLPSTALDTTPDRIVIVREGREAGDGLAIHTSDDGGLTWSTSIERFGLAPGTLGHPTLLRDRARGRLHLAFCWAEGEALQDFGAAAGPPRTMLVATEDAGRTWSEPRDLTPDLDQQDGTWVVPAGGRGIHATTGDMVFPAISLAGKTAMAGPASALVLSRDGGETWSAAPSGVRGRTWPTVFESLSGLLLVNSAGPGLGRRVEERIQLDRREWRVVTRRRSLPLPCAGGAGAILHVGVETHLTPDGRLLFANAAVERKPPRNLVVRGSNDRGSKWFPDLEVLLDDGRGVGGAGLCMLGRERVAVAYRSSSGRVVFQSLPLDALVEPVATFGSVGAPKDF